MSKPTKEKLVDEEEEILQAVILADSFNKRFRPLTTRKPRCLLPICNAPLLDWTFESLALAGVQEVFVICRSHAELVKDAISESKWSKPGSGMKIVPIMTAKETFSPGDAMRDIYTRGLVTSDFVLVMGDLVSNIRIDEVVRVHKERRRTNKDAIMTMVVKESGFMHRTRAQGESSIFVLDPNTSECLHYEHVQGHPRQKFANIPREALAAHPELDIRNDLLDCSIYICSTEVPSLFQDNFDYLDIRRDFVHGILTSDLLMKSIHCYVAEDGYAARVQDTRSYESISKDILSRWTFPLVPDDNHPGGHVYEHTRGNRYIAKDNTVVLARTANIGTNTLIGSSTKVSENVSISASVIGQNCTIGPGTTISNSYIFENAVVGANCHIERSIIGAKANIKDGSIVPKGCLIADGVVVGPNARLETFERLSMKRDSSDDDDNGDESDDDSDIEEVESNQDSIDKTGLGKDSNAVVWPRGPPDEEDDEDGPENWKNQKFMRLGDTAVYSDAESSSSEDESDSDSDAGHDRESLSGISDISMPLDIASNSGGLMEDSEFRTEVTQSLERAFAEGHSVDNAAVELKTLRMASNVPLSRVKEAVVSALVEKITVVDGDVPAQRKEIGSVIGRWGELINKIGGVDPVETVSMLQAHCASSTRMPLFGQILAALYQADIVEEDDIREWHKEPESQGEDRKESVETENFKKCWMIGSHMIQQFDAQESDSGTGTESDTDTEEERKPSATSAAKAVSPPDSDDSDEEEAPKAAASVKAVVPPKPAVPASDDSDDSSEDGVPPSEVKKPEPPKAVAHSETDDSEEEAAAKSKVLATPKPPAVVPKVAAAPALAPDTDDSEAEPEVVSKPVAASTSTPVPEPTKTAAAPSDESESEAEVTKPLVPATSTAAAVEPPKPVAPPAAPAPQDSDSSSEEEAFRQKTLATPKPPAFVPKVAAAVAQDTDSELDEEVDAKAEPDPESAPLTKVEEPKTEIASKPVVPPTTRRSTIVPAPKTVDASSKPSVPPAASSSTAAPSAPATTPADSKAPKAQASSTPDYSEDSDEDGSTDSAEAADGGISEDVSASEDSSATPSANSSAFNSEDEDESD